MHPCCCCVKIKCGTFVLWNCARVLGYYVIKDNTHVEKDVCLRGVCGRGTVCWCVSSVGYWVHQFVIESLHGSTGQTGEDLPVWLTTTKWMFNAPRGDNASCFPSSRRYPFVYLSSEEGMGGWKEGADGEQFNNVCGKTDLWHFGKARLWRNKESAYVKDDKCSFTNTQAMKKYQTTWRKS